MKTVKDEYPVLLNILGVCFAASSLVWDFDVLWYIGFGLVIISIILIIVVQRKKENENGKG